MIVMFKSLISVVAICSGLLVSNIAFGTSEMSYGADVINVPQKGWAIKIVKNKYELILYKDGEIAKRYKVSLGKNKGDKKRVGDRKTPEGRFYVCQFQNAKTWTHDFKGDDYGEIKYAYGPYFIRLKTGRNETFTRKAWRGIGIHGTTNKNYYDRVGDIQCGPASIGHNASEGCIRLNNEDLVELVSIIGKKYILKVPVIIVDGIKRK